MNDKYYQPTIEELLIAIINKESIYQSIKNEIQEIRFIGSIENILYDFIKNNDVRYMYDFENNIITEHSVNTKLYLLKYLDKEDIISLGGKPTLLPYQFEFDLYKLICRDQPYQYIIESMRYQDQVFVGEIKNKSELKRILKQVNQL